MTFFCIIPKLAAQQKCLIFLFITELCFPTNVPSQDENIAEQGVFHYIFWGVCFKKRFLPI